MMESKRYLYDELALFPLRRHLARLINISETAHRYLIMALKLFDLHFYIIVRVR